MPLHTARNGRIAYHYHNFKFWEGTRIQGPCSPTGILCPLPLTRVPLWMAWIDNSTPFMQVKKAHESKSLRKPEHRKETTPATSFLIFKCWCQFHLTCECLYKQHYSVLNPLSPLFVPYKIWDVYMDFYLATSFSSIFGVKPSEEPISAEKSTASHSHRWTDYFDLFMHSHLKSEINMGQFTGQKIRKPDTDYLLAANQ